jgi:hypothetical protein
MLGVSLERHPVGILFSMTVDILSTAAEAKWFCSSKLVLSSRTRDDFPPPVVAFKGGGNPQLSFRSVLPQPMRVCHDSRNTGRPTILAYLMVVSKETVRPVAKMMSFDFVPGTGGFET